MERRTCNKCHEEFSINDFWKNSRYKDGKDPTCKFCKGAKRPSRPSMDHLPDIDSISTIMSESNESSVSKLAEEFNETIRKRDIANNRYIDEFVKVVDEKDRIIKQLREENLELYETIKTKDNTIDILLKDLCDITIQL